MGGEEQAAAAVLREEIAKDRLDRERVIAVLQMLAIGKNRNPNVPVDGLHVLHDSELRDVVRALLTEYPG